MHDASRPSRKVATPRRAAPRAGRPAWRETDGAADLFDTSAHPRFSLDPEESYPPSRRRRDRDPAPRLTLPSMPALPRVRRRSDDGDTGRRRSPRNGAPARERAPRPAAMPYDSGTFDEDFDESEELDGIDDPASSGARRREATAARPLALVPVSARTLEIAALDEPERATAREPEPAREPVQLVPPSPAAYRPRPPLRRPRLDTRALVRRARSPWSLARMALAVLALTLALGTAVAYAGEPTQPLMGKSWQTSSGAHDAVSIAGLVKPETQGTRPDLYDSQQQFNDWWDAACSAAVMSEILTAWGVPHATIGRLIDVMQPDISLNGGLLTSHGFVRGAAAFGYRADVRSSLTYNQMKYITNVLGLPIIVNVRISYGYYHFFSGGHFLVMTGGDDQGLRIVDSSEYYIHYLPKSTFDSMFTGITAVIVPNGYNYTVPAI